MDLQTVQSLISSYPDFPKPGILFRDIHPVLLNVAARNTILQHLVKRYKRLDAIAGLDSRGYYFAMLLSHELQLPFVAIRKRGKLPGDVVEQAYGLEYGTDAIALQKGVLKPNDRVLIVDDLLATGGTAGAACKLVHEVGAEVAEVSVFIELKDLNGTTKLPEGTPFYSVYQM